MFKRYAFLMNLIERKVGLLNKGRAQEVLHVVLRFSFAGEVDVKGF